MAKRKKTSQQQMSASMSSAETGVSASPGPLVKCGDLPLSKLQPTSFCPGMGLDPGSLEAMSAFPLRPAGRSGKIKPRGHLPKY